MASFLLRAADRRLQEGGGAPSPLAQLARALSERGHAASEESSAPGAADAQTVIVGWFVKDGHQAAAGFAAARAVFAGQISPHFPFAESLRVRAEKEAGMPALAIPPLRDEKTAADAAAKIIAHFNLPAEEKSPGLKMTTGKKAGSSSFGLAGTSQLKPAQLQAVAQALKKGDLDEAEKIMPKLDERRPDIGDSLPARIAEQPPLARVLWLRMLIQLRQLGGAGASDIEQIRRALTLMKRELPALSSEDLAQSGASEFTAALNARLNIGDTM